MLDLLQPDEASEHVTRRMATVGKATEMALARVAATPRDEHPEVGRVLHEGVSGDLWTASKALTAASALSSALPVPGPLRRLRRIVTAVLGIAGSRRHAVRAGPGRHRLRS